MRGWSRRARSGGDLRRWDRLGRRGGDAIGRGGGHGRGDGDRGRRRDGGPGRRFHRRDVARGAGANREHGPPDDDGDGDERGRRHDAPGPGRRALEAGGRWQRRLGPRCGRAAARRPSASRLRSPEAAPGPARPHAVRTRPRPRRAPRPTDSARPDRRRGRGRRRRRATPAAPSAAAGSGTAGWVAM